MAIQPQTPNVGYASVAFQSSEEPPTIAGVPHSKCLAVWVCPKNRLYNLNMDKQAAIEMRDHGVKAIRGLMDLLYLAQERCSPEECELIKRGVGLSIGRIDADLLSIIYKQYPELDDVANGA